jgi:hypothetical protein
VNNHIQERFRVVFRSAVMVAMSLCVMHARADATAPLATPPPTEYQVKAAFIYKFASYIQWPPITGVASARPFVIGIFGKDPFGQSFDQIVRGQSVQGRPVVIRRLQGIEDASSCDILFISDSEKGNLRRIFAVLHDAPVLTIGDADRFGERGGMIHLTTENNRIRFDINVKAIERARLKAASQLLRLARIVEESPLD